MLWNIYSHHITEAACQSNRSAWLPKSYHSGISGISGRCWLGYDRGFQQQAAATPTRWAVVDPTLWNLAFSGQAGTSRCRYCFSLSHCSSDCEILLTTQGKHAYSPGYSSPNNIPPSNIPSYMTRPTSQNQPRQNQPPPTRLPATTPPLCYTYGTS